SLRVSWRTWLKFPYPESPSTRIGTDVASAMYSRIVSICVTEASLQSRSPIDADMHKPEAQMARKPARSTRVADSASYAPMATCRSGAVSTARKLALLVIGLLHLRVGTLHRRRLQLTRRRRRFGDLGARLDTELRNLSGRILVGSAAASRR